jgi:hypothetical protein
MRIRLSISASLISKCIRMSPLFTMLRGRRGPGSSVESIATERHHSSDSSTRSLERICTNCKSMLSAGNSRTSHPNSRGAHGGSASASASAYPGGDANRFRLRGLERYSPYRWYPFEPTATASGLRKSPSACSRRSAPLKSYLGFHPNSDLARSLT